MARRTLPVAFLLFGSGFCALIYQTTWLREFRLVFGISTAASAVVIGVFMAGLGFGGIFLGQRSESSTRPLAFYARLELAISITAGISPLLITVVRYLYIAAGGTEAMGIALSTMVRLLFAAIIIGIPTFLMGGTLPAAARSALGEKDIGRRTVGLLYGMNTLGAVAGAFAGTFYCFENLGNRLTLWSAAVLNLLIAAIAFRISTNATELNSPADFSTANGRNRADAKSPQVKFILSAAGLVGFAFFLMELVWYRMLGPLLGGSAFSFGLILAIALLGIGCGGLFYLFLNPEAISLRLFAFTCAAEALLIGLPYALGDRIAMAAMLMRPLGTMGFYGHVIAWTELCLIVVFPAAVLAGLQFPLLIGMLGHGRSKIGSQIGLAYGWNTLGALIGSLAGGFGLIPLLSAPGVWRLVIVILCLTSLAAILFDLRQFISWRTSVVTVSMVAGSISMLAAAGPTAFWRHSQIGVGLLAKYDATPNELRDLIRTTRLKVVWQKDGVESSLALVAANAFSFFVNGRSDGNAKADAGTQVWSGLIGAALHPEPKRAMVVGLGTGSTAGWLAAVPSIEGVDVVELERAMRTVAEACTPVNHDALRNPKLHLRFGDAREFLLTTKRKYDIIASEPSNPHRAGVASVFTREFYQTVARRLNENGIFCQWVQGYQIDDDTMRTIYRSMRSVFASVESWETQPKDLLLVASQAPIRFHLEQLRARLSEEPYRSALFHVWQGNQLEDFLAHYLGNQQLSSAMANVGVQRLNTDDRTVIEFGLARTLGRNNGFQVSNLRAAARNARIDRPTSFDGDANWSRVEEARLPMYDREDQLNPELRARAAASASYLQDDLVGAWQWWRSQDQPPETLLQQEILAECLAAQGDNSALPYIDQIAESSPITAQAIRARLLWTNGRKQEASELLMKVFSSLRDNPWLSFGLTSRSLLLANEISNADSSNARALGFFNVLNTPFAVSNEEATRREVLFNLALKIDGPYPSDYTEKVIQSFEPNVPWQKNILRARQLAYEKTQNARATQARRDVDEFMKSEPANVETLTKEIQDNRPQPAN